MTTGTGNGSALCHTPQPTDDELREKLCRAREAAGVSQSSAREPVQIATTLREDLQRVAEESGPESSTWEPTCIRCSSPLGYIANRRAYHVGQTECDACRCASLENRLQASGIGVREIDQPLETLRPYDPDGKPYGQEYERWLVFLRQFAALRPGERMDPPFAFVYGSNGVGKSAGAERALRAAICNGCSGRVVTFRELVRKIMSAYGSRSDDRAEDIVSNYVGIHLLVIHEVGMEDHTDHNYGLFYDFVDARWRSCQPTIFTSNYSPSIDSRGAVMLERTSDDTKMRAIIDRLSGGFTKDGKAVNLFFLRGKSWRGREVAA